ncbi:MAG: hypothetical protein J6J11_00985 [Treponema sp.]|nr:hypothetical protein [Clostridia bacterium]MBP3562183.1 hypothetical protein [Treponema sp.]MBP3606875.1 hypothetical protein [Treponema sp.]
MKKIILFYILFINLITNISAGENIKEKELNPFSFSPTGNIIDYKDGNNIELIEDWRNFKDKKKLKKVIITIDKENDSSSYYEQYYKNGLMYDEKSRVHDYSERNIIYDSNGNILQIIKPTLTFYYEYETENKRKYYYDNKLRTIESYDVEDNVLTLEEISYTYKINGDENPIYYGKEIEKYFYEDNHLVLYKSNKWNRYNTLSKFERHCKFYYNEKGLLIKTELGYESGKIRTVTNLKYDEDDNLIELYTEDVEDSIVKLIEFSNYDLFGNWRKQKCYYKGELKETIIREIFYKN